MLYELTCTPQHDLLVDVVLPGHASWINRLFSQVPMSLLHIFVDCKDKSPIPFLEQLVYQMPHRSVFVTAAQHGLVHTNLPFLAMERKEVSASPPILFHANHEVPWATPRDSRNYIYPIDQVRSRKASSLPQYTSAVAQLFRWSKCTNNTL